MTSKPNMTRYMIDTYRDLQMALSRTHEALDAAVDDSHDITPQCDDDEFRLLIRNRDMFAAMVVDIRSYLDNDTCCTPFGNDYLWK